MPNEETNFAEWNAWNKRHCMRSTAELAFKYADLGEAGFRHLIGNDQRAEIDEWQAEWTLVEKTVYRLCQVAPHESFPARKSASHCAVSYTHLTLPTIYSV